MPTRGARNVRGADGQRLESAAGRRRRLGTQCRQPTDRASRRCTAATPPRCTPVTSRWTSSSTPPTLAAAPTLPRPSGEVRTVLLTGATGSSGATWSCEWLERMDAVDGTVICLVRAKSDEDARRRLEETFDSGDPNLLRHFQELAAEHLKVIAGDKGEANLGLDEQTWQRLAETRRSDRRFRGLRQRRPALQRVVRPQRGGHRRADPVRAHHEAQALHLRVDCRRGPARSSRRRSPRTPTSGSSVPPAPSTPATPTATATASGPARCCCARPTTCAGCRSRCSARGMILADTTYAGQLNVLGQGRPGWC